MSDTEHENPETEAEDMNGGESIIRAAEPGQMQVKEDGQTLEGRMVPYDEWTEVNSSIEGHFLERFAPGSMAKTIVERGRQVRAMFEHGQDSRMGRQFIADVDVMREEADGVHYSATLLEGLPELLVSGLKKGLYGSSVMGRSVKADIVRHPRKSDYNPEGIPEITRREIAMREFSVVTFPQYANSTAILRSMTDEFAALQLMRDPTRLLEIIERANPEPQHSERERQEAPASERSRSTQPVRDYLKADEGDAEWML